jgi:glycine dehydrogenase
MEALVNFQTMVCDLTGMAIANASMLDEATAAAEAMTLAKRSVKSQEQRVRRGGDCHPQTIEVIQTRAAPLGLTVRWPTRPKNGTAAAATTTSPPGQYPPPAAASTTCAPMCRRHHAKQAAFIVAADLLALTLLKPPGEWAPTSWSAPPSALACPWARAARTPPTWPAATSSSAPCPAAWWA